MTLDQILSEIRLLSTQQRKQLAKVNVASLTEEKSTRTRSILEFEGVGAKLYTGEDAQDYINRLRSEWDERP